MNFLPFHHLSSSLQIIPKPAIYAGFVRLFHKTKRPPGNRATFFLWEAVLTEAKPSELSGERVGVAPSRVKEVFYEHQIHCFEVLGLQIAGILWVFLANFPAQIFAGPTTSRGFSAL